MSQLISVTLPPYISPATWAAFVEIRASKGKRAEMHKSTAELIVKKLKRWHDEGWDAEYILEAAVMGEWTGLYLPRDCPRINPEVAASRDWIAEQEHARRESQTEASFAAKRAAIGKHLRKVG